MDGLEARVRELSWLMALRTYSDLVDILPSDTPIPEPDSIDDFCIVLSQALKKKQQRRTNERQAAKEWASNLAGQLRANSIVGR